MPRRLINKRHISNELDEVIDANLNESHDLMVGVVLKAIARELSAFDLDRDEDKLHNNPRAFKAHQRSRSRLRRKAWSWLGAADAYQRHETVCY